MDIHIHINDRWFNLLKRHRYFILVAGVIGFAAGALADDISLTVFSSGDVVSASAINNNFSTLLTQINQHSTAIATLQEASGGGGGGNSYPPLEGVVKLAHSISTHESNGTMCAILDDDSVRCWGPYQKGITLAGDTLTHWVAGPAWISEESAPVEISITGQNVFVLFEDGTVAAAGENGQGQLGNNTTSADISETLTIISGLTDVIDIRSASKSVCALISDGTIKCWGDNVYGQLGIGNTDDQSTPQTVDDISTAISIGAGHNHFCALLDGGTVKCWGHGNYGELGNGATDNQSTPVLADITGATGLVVGYGNTCAIVADGAIKCWGGNGQGNLGNGTVSGYSSSPVDVTGITGATRIESGSNHFCAKVASTLKCWGKGDSGNLGSQTMSTNNPTPVTATGVTDIADLALFGTTTCVLESSGRVKCFGNNTNSECGTGTWSVNNKVLEPAEVRAFQ